MRATADALAGLRAAPGVIRLHGHRGARGVMPENTMAGFAFTLACGIKVIEFDVLFARDATPVVTHNMRLSGDSTRDESGAWLAVPGPEVISLTVEELRRYDVGGLRDNTLYGARYPDQAFLEGQRIPTLDELAELLARSENGDVWLNLEIKSNPLKPGAVPPIDELVAATLEVVERHGLAGRTLIQSFDWRVLREVAAQAPGMARSFLSARAGETPGNEDNIHAGSPWMAGLDLADFNGSLPQLVAGAGGEVWSPRYRDLTHMELVEAHELGLIVNVWTVNEVRDIDRMIELGVDGIITDFPGRAQRRLKAVGMGWV